MIGSVRTNAAEQWMDALIDEVTLINKLQMR